MRAAFKTAKKAVNTPKYRLAATTGIIGFGAGATIMYLAVRPGAEITLTRQSTTFTAAHIQIPKKEVPPEMPRPGTYAPSTVEDFGPSSVLDDFISYINEEHFYIAIIIVTFFVTVYFSFEPLVNALSTSNLKNRYKN